MWYWYCCWCSVAQSCPTLCNSTEAHQASLSFTISRSLLTLMSTVSVMPSNHLILCRPLLLLPSVFLSIRLFSNESALRIRWPKYWSFLLMYIQGWFPLELTDLVSLLSKGLWSTQFESTQPSLYIFIYYLLKPFFLCFLHRSQCCFLTCELSGSAHIKKLESDRKVPSKLIQALTTFF